MTKSCIDHNLENYFIIVITPPPKLKLWHIILLFFLSDGNAILPFIAIFAVHKSVISRISEELLNKLQQESQGSLKYIFVRKENTLKLYVLLILGGRGDGG